MMGRRRGEVHLPEEMDQMHFSSILRRGARQNLQR